VTARWLLRLLALVIALALWAAVTARERRQATVEATLRVVPVVLGTPAAGYGVTAVRVEPNVVVVRGHRSTIGRREGIETAPVDVAGRRTRVTEIVGLALPDAASVLGEHGGVRVTVDIEARRGTALDTEAGRR